MLDDDEYLLLEDEEIVQDTDKADADCDFVDLDIDDLKVGLNFASEAIAIKSIENWSYTRHCVPLLRSATGRGRWLMVKE